MWKWIISHPLRSVCVVALGLPMVDAFLKRKAAKELYLPVVTKLTQGLDLHQQSEKKEYGEKRFSHSCEKCFYQNL